MRQNNSPGALPLSTCCMSNRLAGNGRARCREDRERRKALGSSDLKMLKDLAEQRLSGLKCETRTKTAFLSDTAKAILTVRGNKEPDLSECQPMAEAVSHVSSWEASPTA